MPPIDYDGTYTSTTTIAGLSGTMTISGGNTSFSYTPSGGTPQAFTPSSKGASIAFKLTVGGDSYDFHGVFTQGNSNKQYKGTIHQEGKSSENDPTWTAST